MPVSLVGWNIDATWLSEPEGKTHHSPITVSWVPSGPAWVGVPGGSSTQLGKPSLSWQQYLGPVGANYTGFGSLQITLEDDYIYPNAFCDASWHSATPYAAPINVVIALWHSGIEYIAPPSIPTSTVFGSPTLISQQIVSPVGLAPTVTFGRAYTIFDWQYNLPTWSVDARWRQGQYNPPVEFQNARWLGRQFCNEQWYPKPFFEIDFDLKSAWQSRDFDEIDFNFTCAAPGCETLWTEYPGNQVPIAFKTPWTEYPGNQVPITFQCGEGPDEPDYTFFTGYIEAADGELAEFNIATSWILNSYSGAAFDFALNDLSGTIRPDFYDGAWVGGSGCDVVESQQIQLRAIHSYDAIVQPVGNSGTIQTQQSPYGGGNLAAEDVIRASQPVEFAWNQTLSPESWYDNDNTDAVARFELFLTNSYDSTSRPTSYWTYSDPSWQASPPVITWWIPFGTGVSGEVRYKNSGTGLDTLAFTTTSDINLFDGTKRIRVLYSGEAGQTRIRIFADDVQLGTGLIPYPVAENIAPVWHYHNYSGLTPVYSVTDVEVTLCSDILTTYPMAGMGLLDIRDGAEVSASLATDDILPLEFFDGAEVSPIYLGSEVYLDDVNVYADAAMTANVTDNPPWQISVNAYEGASVAPVLLNTTGLLDFEFTEGAQSSFTLSEVPFWTFYEGASSNIEIEIYPSENFGGIFNFEGASAAVDNLSTTHSIPASAYDGAEAWAYLATDTNLETISFFSDGVLVATLTDNPPWQMSVDAHEGACGELDLSTTDTLQPRAFDGAQGDIDLDLRPAPEMLLLAYADASASASISISQALNGINHYEGASATITSLDSTEFWIFGEGASATTSLATEATLPGSAFAGEDLDIDLETRESESLGTFLAYEGTRSDLVLQGLVAVLLYPNRISGGFEYTCEFDINTSFDLNNTACCAIRDTHERIELSDHPMPDEYYHGDKWTMVVDLSTRPRFQMEFYDGASLYQIDPIILGEIEVFEGPSVSIGDMYDDVNFKLCYGNFIPDGDVANIELVGEYGSCEESWTFGEGAHVDLFMENNVQFQVNTYAGQYMAFDLYIDPLMLFLAWSGEFIRISNPEFVPPIFEGAMVSMAFEEHAWRAQEGATLEVSLTTEYDVEFLEVGCLDNEFVPADEHGDADWEKFNPVPVELEYYRHSIKARCF